MKKLSVLIPELFSALFVYDNYKRLKFHSILPLNLISGGRKTIRTTKLFTDEKRKGRNLNCKNNIIHDTVLDSSWYSFPPQVKTDFASQGKEHLKFIFNLKTPKLKEGKCEIHPSKFNHSDTIKCRRNMRFESYWELTVPFMR